MAKAPIRVTVDGQGYSAVLLGRAAAIALLIVTESERINRVRCGSLSLNWDGDSLRPEWRESGARLNLQGNALDST